ncbi:HEPN domain-containing protein [bacterium]|nr:HEPN domain-containing protein [bacterium]
MEKLEKIKKKFSDLIITGNKFLDNCGLERDNGIPIRRPSNVDYLQFRTEATNLVKRVCGEESVHYYELKKISDDKTKAHNSYYFKECLGIVKAALSDYEDGFLFDLKSLVQAELLGDFIDQCEELFESNYISAAASLCGAVLEDSLRKLSLKNNIKIDDKTKISVLNANLAKKNIYSKLVSKQIIALADIRNNADHGHHKEFTDDDVKNMIKYTKRFLVDFLG